MLEDNSFGDKANFGIFNLGDDGQVGLEEALLGCQTDTFLCRIDNEDLRNG